MFTAGIGSFVLLFLGGFGPGGKLPGGGGREEGDIMCLLSVNIRRNLIFYSILNFGLQGIEFRVHSFFSLSSW